MTEYAFNYQPSEKLLNRAMYAWSKPPQNRRQKAVRIVYGVLLYVVLTVGILAFLRHDLISNHMIIGGVLGVWVGAGGMIALNNYSMGKIKGFTHDAMERHGMTYAVFRAECVEMKSEISATRMDWLCFDDVIPLGDATVLRTGSVIYAIPDDALPVGVAPAQFRTDLQKWMEAAR